MTVRGPGRSTAPRLMESGDRSLEGFTSDEPHHVIGTAIVPPAQAADGDDPRMLQAAGNLGFAEEPRLRAPGRARIHPDFLAAPPCASSPYRGDEYHLQTPGMDPEPGNAGRPRMGRPPACARSAPGPERPRFVRHDRRCAGLDRCARAGSARSSDWSAQDAAMRSASSGNCMAYSSYVRTRRSSPPGHVHGEQLGKQGGPDRLRTLDQKRSIRGRLPALQASLNRSRRSSGSENNRSAGNVRDSGSFSAPIRGLPSGAGREHLKALAMVRRSQESGYSGLRTGCTRCQVSSYEDK